MQKPSRQLREGRELLKCTNFFVICRKILVSRGLRGFSGFQSVQSVAIPPRRLSKSDSNETEKQHCVRGNLEIEVGHAIQQNAKNRTYTRKQDSSLFGRSSAVVQHPARLKEIFEAMTRINELIGVLARNARLKQKEHRSLIPDAL